jgi:nitrous oxidase accessory protein
MNTSSPDRPAVWTIVLVAAAALIASWFLPWWEMEGRAPQYGQRALVVQVGPRTVGGDVREIDCLGHYVGIRPMDAVAGFERKLAPFGIALAVLGLAVAPWLGCRRCRFVAVLPVLLAPAIFLADLSYWMNRSANDRDPEAALNLTVTQIDAKLFGDYAVGQFQMRTRVTSGFYLAACAALLAAGLVFARPLSRVRPGATPVLAAALVLAFTLAPAHASPVAPGGLADALERARDGDTLVVGTGVHRGPFTVTRRVTLRGAPGAILSGAGEGTVLTLRAAGTRVEDLTITASGDSYNAEDSGVRIENADDVALAHVTFTEVLFGAFLLQANRCVIDRCTVVGKDLPVTRRGDGIRLWYSSDCRLTGNVVDRSRDVVIWYSSGTVVEDNLVHHSRYGLHYMYSNKNVFRGNRFEDNEVGAAIMYSRDIRLTGNTFSFSRGPAAYGLLVKDADDVFIEANRIVDNDCALFFDGAPQAKDGTAEIHGNLVARNGVGIALEPSSHGVKIWENAFTGNRVQVQINGTGNALKDTWAVGGRGNYWSDALVYDPDGAGVSRVPHREDSTFEVLSDRYPGLAFFDGAPAGEAIDLASRLFPLFAPRPKMEDPAPLARPPVAPEAGEVTTPDPALARTGLAFLVLSMLIGTASRKVLA